MYQMHEDRAGCAQKSEKAGAWVGRNGLQIRAGLGEWQSHDWPQQHPSPDRHERVSWAKEVGKRLYSAVRWEVGCQSFSDLDHGARGLSSRRQREARKDDGAQKASAGR